ncbi:ABC transporter [Phytophthora megakarya]|uniref:ABC transporter n=1 Tax=Phytophthora megakarya TaxID=4795 RepID=A0A225VIN9_9STRA|nr:ABC transporter [Phytophthora megakarya]
MHRWFKAFPEVMMINATHNTTESQYKLFSLMVHNIYGHVQILTLGNG